jgi:hypothetical protein
MENESKDIKSQAEILKTQAKELLNQAKQLEKSTIEKFDWKKFLSSFNVLNPVLWSKWLCGAVRTVIVVGVVVGILFGLGYWKGITNKPITVGYKDFVATMKDKDGTSHTVSVKGGILYFDGVAVRGKDIKDLEAFGIKIRPKVFFGVGNGLEPEVGLGAQIIKFYKFNWDIFGTQRAIYTGISYDLDIKNLKWLQNSSIGIGVGKEWDNIINGNNDLCWLAYWSIKF